MPTGGATASLGAISILDKPIVTAQIQAIGGAAKGCSAYKQRKASGDYQLAVSLTIRFVCFGHIENRTGSRHARGKIQSKILSTKPS
ncbi:MAG: hypothetical protein HZC50_10635 [Nitrospirae bacterium]|nr:hypothetical protein [Nitrospirota bacterium]